MAPMTNSQVLSRRVTDGSQIRHAVAEMEFMPNQITAANAGWRLQFVEKSLVGGCHYPRAAELLSLACFTHSP
jgi:hypothetical protein